MAFKTEWIRFGKDGRQAGFLARPDRAAAPVPAVLVIQEAWGVDGHIEDVTLRFAQAGYVALAPDLYAEDGERPARFSRPRMEAVKIFMDSLPPGAPTDMKSRKEAIEGLPEPRRSEVRESFDALFYGRGRPDGNFRGKALGGRPLPALGTSAFAGRQGGGGGFLHGGRALGPVGVR